ncbi:hypothetical protein B0P06_003469 [Clostridium saccharoperbutylacetonicum]|nr:hypothetical protein [Clostridium saccharoperbutylacetonicum]NRT61007.1 hypothetical protein [Clostridium saccharoperbutylacetonicum]NSB24322.1 hypothetical protein [Clostridium saccharoperbutylacetonicum]NSB43698.1 hypothetical protein [Clostridium saccharoperbutylacetonicum]
MSSSSASFVESATYQISNVVCKDNGTVVTNPVLTNTLDISFSLDSVGQ